MRTKRLVIFGWANSVHTNRWARGLSERGLAVKIVSLDGEPRSGIETHIIPRRSRMTYFLRRREAIREAKAFCPDIVHAHYATGFGWWLRAVDFCPTVLSVWGADVIDFPSNPFTRAMVRAVLRRPNHITATSRLLERVTLELLPSAKGRISVIPFGVEMPETTRSIPEGDLVRLCYIKVHSPKYGPDVLLRALAKALESCPGLQLTMAGQGGMTERLKAMTRELGVSENVEFPGFVDHDRINDFLGAHHLMIMPSVMDSESFGVAALEAAACERPVIASRVGGVPEAVVDRETGILVAPGDVDELAGAIVRLARDKDLRRKMGRAGRDFVAANYTWDKSLDMMIDLYERVLNEKDAE